MPPERRRKDALNRYADSFTCWLLLALMGAVAGAVLLVVERVLG